MSDEDIKRVEGVVIPRPKLIPLSKLPERINREAAAVNEAAVKMLEHILKCGDYLLQAKQQLPYGEFNRWAEANCVLGYAQARRYMKIAKNWPRLPESRKKRAAELTSFRQIIAVVTGKEINEKEPRAFGEARPRSERRTGTECRYRGCVRPAEAIVYCDEHMRHAVDQWLGGASREELASISQYIETLMEEAED
jgi:hypothetical protein